MVRTIYVVFTKAHYPRGIYTFLCSNDNVKVGDIIIDPRYSSPMEVKGITNRSLRVQRGLTLKDVQVKFLISDYPQDNNYNINKQRNNMEEKRNISISLEEAREWYNSGNKTLKSIALKAYSSKELTNYESIRNKVCLISVWCDIPNGEETKINILRKLAIIAKYYNGDWQMKAGKNGYFIGQQSVMGRPMKVVQVNSSDDIAIFKHDTIHCAGIVYFKDPKDALAAANILGDELDLLF